MFVRFEVPPEEGCFDPQNKLWWDRDLNRPISTHTEGADPFLLGEFRLDDGTPVKPAFQLLVERGGVHPGVGVQDHRHPGRDHQAPGPRDGHRRARREDRAADPWTDTWGKEHESVTGNPVSFHAMRGLAAHSNGFHTIRALSILMSILGTIDRPGGFRHKAPFPRPIPPCAKTPTGPRACKPNTPLGGMPLGWPADPDDLFVDDAGNPVRIDKAFSWEYPLSVHGLMHNAITNAWRRTRTRSTPC
jgi:sulfite dehydrogenase (quinone) subunit SoeA